MLEVELNDLLVFEDENDNTYYDCVRWVSTWSDSEKTYDCKDFRITVANDDIKIGAIKEAKYKLKEIWHKVDEDTYKRVYVKSNKFN